MATPQENIARFQEIANRGLQDNLDPQKRAIFDEGVNRGIITFQPAAEQVPEGGAVSGVLEPAAAIVSGVVAEPLAGLFGLGVTALEGPEAGAQAVEQARQALTFDPKTQSGKESLQSIAETLQPVGEAIGKIETGLGESVLEATGSPALAAIAHSLPTAVLEGIGVKGLRSTKLATSNLSGDVAQAITQAAPDLNTIKNRATDAYNELDNLGIRVKPSAYENFANKLQSKLIKEGLDKDLTPKSNAALNRILDDVGQAKRPSELNTMRKIAASAASSIEPPDARLGTIIVNEIDDALDSLSTSVGGKFKEARGLSQRAFKSQAITDMIENASHTASGMENGLRIEARKILKSKKKRRGFTADELNALKRIEQGTTASNTAKFLGKFGISEGQATSMLGASIGIGGGGALGAAFGGASGAGIGALTVPVLGQIAKKTAQRITLNNTKFADDLVRSGKNAKAITRAYLKHTPTKDRSVSDLTDLLLDPDLNIAEIKSLPKSAASANKLIADSLHFANEIKRRATQAGSIGVIASPEIGQEE